MLSPDGQWLVYGNRRDAQTGLRVRNLATGDERWLAYPIQRDDMESRFTRDLLPGSSFTPDSRYVVSAWNGKIYKIEVATSKQAEIPFSAAVHLKMGPLVKFDFKVDTGEILLKQIRDRPSLPTGSASCSRRSIGCTRWTCPMARRSGSPPTRCTTEPGLVPGREMGRLHHLGECRRICPAGEVHRRQGGTAECGSRVLSGSGVVS
jgi:hypothetical protein